MDPGRVAFPRRTGAPVAAVAVLVFAGGLIGVLRTIRIGEAAASRAVLAVLGVEARQIGSTVIVDSSHGPAGFTVAAGCSSALLLVPFALLSVALIGSKRVRPRAVVVALLGATLILPLVNQIRFVLIGASIDRWGFDRGYAPAHVIAGTVVSMVGLVAALVAFVAWCLGSGRRALPFPSEMA